jgi:diketogulonate reductase-like aldo/keto reductase
MHSTYSSPADTLIVWKALSTYVPHKIHHLGVANTPLADVRLLLAPEAGPSPAVVQNRFYDRTAWEVPLRSLCRQHGIVFQTFWTLTGNPALLRSPPVGKLASAAEVGKEVALYALVLGLGNTTILDGTTNETHMKEDLEGVQKVGNWAEGQGQSEWKTLLAEFKGLIKEAEE